MEQEDETKALDSEEALWEEKPREVDYAGRRGEDQIGG